MENSPSLDMNEPLDLEARSRAPHRPTRADAFCPQCDHNGKLVGGQTVKSQLAVSLRLVENTPYYFCRTVSCQVVYFSADGKSVFTTNQVRERVYQKESTSDKVKVCYCFGHSAGELRAATPAAEKLIIDEIKAGISAGQCACDLRNPQGTCCLGNVQRLVAQQ